MRVSDARTPSHVVENELHRLMGYGIIRSFGASAEGEYRRWRIVFPNGDRASWTVGMVMAFVRGAMAMAEREGVA